MVVTSIDRSNPRNLSSSSLYLHPQFTTGTEDVWSGNELVYFTFFQICWIYARVNCCISHVQRITDHSTWLLQSVWTSEITFRFGINRLHGDINFSFLSFCSADSGSTALSRNNEKFMATPSNRCFNPWFWRCWSLCCFTPYGSQAPAWGIFSGTRSFWQIRMHTNGPGRL